VEVELHVILTPALKGGGRLVSRFDRFATWRRETDATYRAD